MTQEEHWTAHWRGVMDFMEANRRNPSKYHPEERDMHNWWKHQKKLFNADRMPAGRQERFRQMLALGEKYQHVNQYQ
jgi:hypothetical protein